MIHPLRPLLMISTPLNKVPRAWLEMVEPKILRSGACWFWQGAVDTYGEPVTTIVDAVTGRRSTVRLKKIVADLYWAMKPGYEILHVCKNINCLNPVHFYVTDKHWTAEDRAKIIDARAARIEQYARRHK